MVQEDNVLSEQKKGNHQTYIDVFPHKVRNYILYFPEKLVVLIAAHYSLKGRTQISLDERKLSHAQQSFGT